MDSSRASTYVVDRQLSCWHLSPGLVWRRLCSWQVVRHCYEYSYRTASHIRQGLQGCCYFLEIACYICSL